MKSPLTIIACLIMINISFAQSAYSTYKMQSIYLKGSKFVKNDVAYPIGLLGGKLAPEMQVSEHATAEWQKFKKVRNWGIATSLAGLGLAVSALATENNDLRAGLLLGGLTLSLVSLPLSLKSSNQLQKAVWTRNRDILQF